MTTSPDASPSATTGDWQDAPRVEILNAWVHDVSMEDLVRGFTEGTMLTLHTDMMMKLQTDREFYDILGDFDVITCDSQIMYFVLKLMGRPVQARVSGSDFFPRFYRHHRDNPEIRVFLCGGMPGIPELARDRINEKVGRDIIVGVDSPAFDFDNNPAEIDRMLGAIADSGATVCLVGLHGGRQEKFIMRHRDRVPGVKLWLPLGGTIDYESGTLPRPPGWVTDAGLEWLYRVAKQPRVRFRRYFIENPPFLWLALKQKLGLYRNPFA